MKLVAVDASFAAAWLLPDEASREADRVLQRALDGELSLCAPDLWQYEMCNLVVMACRRGRIGEAQLQEAMTLLSELPIVFYDHHEPLVRRRIMSFAVRYRLSAYDAAYLELADRLQCQLLTNDDALLAAAAQIDLSGER